MAFSGVDACFLRRAIAIAIEARTSGDDPFGAILVHDGDIVMEARNAIHSDNDVTQHPELMLVSKASRSLSPAVMENSTLYASTEPCEMCKGAIHWAGVPRVVFGYAAANLKTLVRGATDVERRAAQYEGPWLADEAFAPHDGYWDT
jgi:tRNA(Arg) A34 adenosine deaminase TadA